MELICQVRRRFISYSSIDENANELFVNVSFIRNTSSLPVCRMILVYIINGINNGKLHMIVWPTALWEKKSDNLYNYSIPISLQWKRKRLLETFRSIESSAVL